MKLFGLEIRRAPRTEPGFSKQRDLWYICPVCGRMAMLNRLDDGRTILTALWGIDKICRIEFTCPKGHKLILFSKEEVFEKIEPAEWERLAKEAMKH